MKNVCDTCRYYKHYNECHHPDLMHPWDKRIHADAKFNRSDKGACINGTMWASKANISD